MSTEAVRPSRGGPVLTPIQLAISIAAILVTAAVVVGLVVVVPPAVRAAAPDRPVQAYLEAVVRGDISKALVLGRITPAKDDKLLTDAAYGQSAGRITSFSVLGTAVHGTAGTVQVRVMQGRTGYAASFTVQRVPGIGLFAPWRLAPQQLPRLRASFNAPVGLAVNVAGVTLTPSNGAVVQHVFPGTYAVAAASSGLFSATTTTAVASFADATADATMSVSLTAEGESAASAQVQAWVEQCAASSELAPAGCPFKALPQASVTYSNGKWTVESQPALTTGAWNAGLHGWPITTSAPGYVSFTANAREGALTGTATTGSTPFAVTGTAVPDGSGIRFVPSPAYSAGSDGALT